MIRTIKGVDYQQYKLPAGIPKDCRSRCTHSNTLIFFIIRDSSLFSMERYHRRRLRTAPIETNNNQMIKRQENRTFLGSSQIPPLQRQLLQSNDNQGIEENRFDVGFAYEVDHQNLPPWTSVHLKSIRVVVMTEKTDSYISVRYPSIGSLCDYLSYNMQDTDVYPYLSEVFVMGIHLAGKVLGRKISAKEFYYNHSDVFWLKRPEPGPLPWIFKKETTIRSAPLKSKL
ncbi:hypothetical protein POM88_015785 [Heracleum sosnowskyi]|uniref:Uncharacterized protein n=1 Tax=Heracleum sosnowskyi TaxID=360622 RepID=A0AAD8IKU1_9APIA|nr:hypothetical protein POM88_015785 [Heracleum sosnowskyi]